MKKTTKTTTNEEKRKVKIQRFARFVDANFPGIEYVVIDKKDGKLLLLQFNPERKVLLNYIIADKEWFKGRKIRFNFIGGKIHGEEW